MSLQCRICLDEDIIDNLCSPCNCNGTSKYIHPHCLTKWRNENVNTPYYNKCIDCHTDYKYSVERNEQLILNNKKILYSNIFLFGLITLLLNLFDNEASFKIFNSIKDKNISQQFNQLEDNYYYIFYYIILANYLVNCLFFILSYICLFKIMNIEHYIRHMCCAKIYNAIKLFYIIILYLILSLKAFLATSFLLVFIDTASINLYIEQHNNILNDINTSNIRYYVETYISENATIENIDEYTDTENEINHNNNYNQRLI